MNDTYLMNEGRITYLGSAPPPEGRAQMVRLVDGVFTVIAEGSPESIEALARDTNFDVINFSDGRRPLFRKADGEVVGWAAFRRSIEAKETP